MVVAGRESAQVAQSVEGDVVFRRAVSKSSRVTRNFALGDVVRCLTTDEETVASKDRVSSKGRTFEEIDKGAAVGTGLLVSAAEDGSLGALVGVEAGVKLEFQALGDLVLEFHVGAEEVGGSPRLRKSDSVLGVRVFRFNVTVDDVGFRVGISCDLEGHVGGGLGLDLE